MPTYLGNYLPNVYLGEDTPITLQVWGPENNLWPPEWQSPGPDEPTLATEEQGGGGIIPNRTVFLPRSEWDRIRDLLCPPTFWGSGKVMVMSGTKSKLVFASELAKLAVELDTTCAFLAWDIFTSGSVSLFAGFQPDEDTDALLIDAFNALLFESNPEPVVEPPPEEVTPTEPAPAPEEPPPEEVVVVEPEPVPVEEPIIEPEPVPEMPTDVVLLDLISRKLDVLAEAIVNVSGEVRLSKKCCDQVLGMLTGLPEHVVKDIVSGTMDQAPILSLTWEEALPVIAQMVSDGNFLLSQENELLTQQLNILKDLLKMGTVFSAVQEFPGWKPTGQKQSLIFSGGLIGVATIRFISDKIPYAFVVREITFWAGSDGTEWFAFNYGYSTSNNSSDVFGVEITRLFNDPTATIDVLVGIGRNLTISPNILVGLPDQYIHWEATNNDLTFQIAGTAFSIERMEPA